MADFLKVVDICLNYLKGNNYIGLAYIILGVLSSWLFKELRKNKVETNNANTQRVAAALQIYAKVIIYVGKYKRSVISFESLLDELPSIYPYAGKNIINASTDYIKAPDDKKLENLEELLLKEIMRLKLLQYDKISYNETGRTIDSLYFYYKKNYESFVTPLAQTAIAIVGIFILMIFLLVFGVSGNIRKVLLLCLLGSSFFYIILVMTSLELIYEKRFKKTIFNICALGVLISSIMLFFIDCVEVTVITFMLIVFIYLIFIFKHTVKK